MAGRYAHDRAVMVEALDKMVSESLTAEVRKIAAERELVSEDRVKFTQQMLNKAKNFDSYLSESLAGEVRELRSDRANMQKAISKLEAFVAENLQNEIAEFAQDKADLARTKVAVVTEGRKKLEALGHTTTIVNLDFLDYLLPTYYILTEAEARDIVAITASPNNTLESDLPPFPPRETKVFHYSIAATVHNPELFPKIEKGIVNYIDNVPTIKAHLNQLRQSTVRRMVKEKEEIAFLESTKKMILEGRGQVLDLGSVSRHLADINDKMEDHALFLDRLEHELILTRPMEIVRKPSSPGHYRALGFGAAVGFFGVLTFMAVLALARFSKQA
jgi:hypothetical protein